MANFWPKIGEIGRNFTFFFIGGPNLKCFEILLFNLFLLSKWVMSQNLSKTKQISWLYSVVCFYGFWQEEFYSSCNASSKNGHRFWAQPPKSMKVLKNMPYMYMLKVKKFWVCAYLRLGTIKENIVGDANLHHLAPE